MKSNARGRRKEIGSRDAPQTREWTAHHEAGHFVAAYFHGMVDDGCEITIAQSGDAAGMNRLYGHPLDEDCSRKEIERFIIGLFAGYEAEVRFDPARSTSRFSAAADDAEAEEWLPKLAKTEAEREKLGTILRSKTRALLDEHWAAVCALAQELLQHTTLDGYEATWIVAIAEGEYAGKELPAYRRNRDAAFDRVASLDAVERAKALLSQKGNTQKVDVPMPSRALAVVRARRSARSPASQRAK